MKLPRKREPIDELRGRVAASVTGRQPRHRRNAKRAQEEFAVDFSRATPEERKQAVRRLEAIVKGVETMLRIKKKLKESNAEYREQRRHVTHGGGVITEEEFADPAPEERRAKKQRCS